MNQLNIDHSRAVLPRRSSRLATIIPASYWISVGYPEAGAQARVNLQLDMKKYSEDNGDETNIKLIPKGNNMLPLLRKKILHDDMLIPHWQRFAKSLNGRTSVHQIHIKHFELPISVLDIILPTFQSMDNLTEISLFKAGLGNDELQRLSTFLKGNTLLRKVQFGGWGVVDDLSVVSSFSDAVKNHPTLESIALSLRLNNIHLQKVLEGCIRVRELKLLSSTTLESDGGAVTLSEFISSNHPVETLSLSNNNISDNDMLLLASALKKNTKLNFLNLRNNDITEEGRKTLLKAIYDPTSMNFVESNHTCIPYTCNINNNLSILNQLPLPSLEREVLNINRNFSGLSIQQRIRKKVVLALCRQDGGLFDLSHFDDIPLQLMPRVLELIQEHTENRTEAVRSRPVQLEKDALSRLFHILTGWELPLLFENLRGPSAKGSLGKRKRRKTCR